MSLSKARFKEHWPPRAATHQNGGRVMRPLPHLMEDAAIALGGGGEAALKDWGVT
ncbi:hypothetical protein JDN40_10190 [Rhodomicrobium vannielii ATCC 17100]|uniref:hypothetical protein n=1 Tax=Rhodomicrobium vannielii TaxID=1069 RepID=UPI00191B320D|nr:hypothetical protein [Rhodomicrobium vannielii]MBJ7534472.1 hypothetical protein [Rhodomicrobium vannielii ATCC 17100]